MLIDLSPGGATSMQQS